MDIPDRLQCLFAAQIEERDGSYVIEIPRREVQLGSVQQGDTYQVALMPSSSNEEKTQTDTRPDRERDFQRPPVEEGETRRVEIEDIGDQGDGVTRVERGFVVIVPDTEQGERVAVEVTDVRENVAFAEVTERLSYYD